MQYSSCTGCNFAAGEGEVVSELRAEDVARGSVLLAVPLEARHVCRSHDVDCNGEKRERVRTSQRTERRPRTGIHIPPKTPVKTGLLAAAEASPRLRNALLEASLVRRVHELLRTPEHGLDLQHVLGINNA